MSRLRNTFHMEELTYHVFAHGILLCCMLLAASLLTLVWAGAYTYQSSALYAYAFQLWDSAVLVLGAAMLGAVLLEDVMRST